MIRKAVPQDLPVLKKLTEACAKALQEKGIFQWNDHYPSLQRLEEDIAKKELFVLEEEQEIQGMVVLTPKMDEEYLPVKWLSQSADNLYVHRLATRPGTWGSGYGKALMDFAEAYAREQSYVSVRLDTFSQNQRNQTFYESRGYVKLGTIFFPKQSEEPFFCYEKLLK